jgi:hypothetical protein
MDVDCFFKLRTAFIRTYYATAVVPFETIKTQIEAGETPAVGGLLRVRSKAKAFWRNEPKNSFWRNEPKDSFWRNEPEVCGGQTASKICRTIEKSGCYRPFNRVD